MLIFLVLWFHRYMVAIVGLAFAGRGSFELFSAFVIVNIRCLWCNDMRFLW